MKHKMNLWNDSFEAIKDGWKTIRSKIEIGDEIEFTNTETNEEIICEVIKIYKYNSFEELYKNHNKISIGYKEDETANPNDMLMYYSKDNIDKYGVLGIEITLKWQSIITTKGCETRSRVRTFLMGYGIILNVVFLDILKCLKWYKELCHFYL